MWLYLIRHGEPEGARGRGLGHLDLPLSATGLAQAEALAASWQGRAPDRIYSSDLQRAQQTATPLARRFALDLKLDPRLREMALGDWDGQPWDELRERDPAVFDHWAEDWVRRAPPGGECFQALHARNLSWLREVQDMPDAGVVLAYAHAGTLRALLCEATGMSLDQAFTWRVDYAASFALQWLSGRFEVCYANAPRFESIHGD